jgi:hypothetical protein
VQLHNFIFILRKSRLRGGRKYYILRKSLTDIRKYYI